MKNKIKKFADNIDFKLLKKQKIRLLLIANGEPVKTPKQIEEIEGAIAMLDAFQDFLVDECGIPHEQVFPLKKKK
jgi:uncharacterized protein YeeX (DUF496 family)